MPGKAAKITITERQQEIWNFLVDYVDRGAGSPNPPAERFPAWRAEHNAN